MKPKNHFKADTYQFSDILREYPLFDHEIADLTASSLKTVKRWHQNDDAPKAIKRLIWIHASGYLPNTKGWNDMRIDRKGFLHDGLGRTLTAGDIRASFFDAQRILSLQNEVKTLRHELSHEVKPTNIVHFPLRKRFS